MDLSVEAWVMSVKQGDVAGDLWALSGEHTHRMSCERIYPAYRAAISEIDKHRPSGQA